MWRTHHCKEDWRQQSKVEPRELLTDPENTLPVQVAYTKGSEAVQNIAPVQQRQRFPPKYRLEPINPHPAQPTHTKTSYPSVDYMKSSKYNEAGSLERLVMGSLMAVTCTTPGVGAYNTYHHPFEKCECYSTRDIGRS